MYTGVDRRITSRRRQSLHTAPPEKPRTGSASDPARRPHYRIHAEDRIGKHRTPSLGIVKRVGRQQIDELPVSVRDTIENNLHFIPLGKFVVDV